MKITEKEQKGLKRGYDVVVPAKDVNAKYDAKLNALSKEAKIQGFRPGKVPASVLKSRYGDTILKEVLQEVLQDNVQALLKEKNLLPAMQPTVNVNNFAEGKDLEFSIAFEIVPEIPEVDFSKVKIKKVYSEVEDSAVEKELNRLAELRKDSVKVEENRAAKDGDIAVIDFVGSIDGKEFAGGKGTDYPLEIGSGAFIAGFEEQLVGKKIGKETVVKVTFPADYHAKEFAGKDAEFKVTIKELRTPVKPEINDDFAKVFGKKDVAELKETIKKEIAEAYEGMTFMHLKRALLDELSDMCKFEVPECMLNAEFSVIWSQAIAEAKANGEELTDEDKQEYTKIADRRVRLGLLLTEVGKKQDIHPSPADVNKILVAEVRRNPAQQKAILDMYQNNENFRTSVNSRAFEDKVMTFILEKVTQEPLKVTEEELYTYYDDDDKPAEKKPAKAKAVKPAKAEKAEKPAKPAEKKADKAEKADKKPAKPAAKKAVKAKK